MSKITTSLILFVFCSFVNAQAREHILGPVGQTFFAKEFLYYSPFSDDDKSSRAFLAGVLFATLQEKTDSAIEINSEKRNASAFHVGTGFYRYIKRQYRAYVEESGLEGFMKQNAKYPAENLAKLSELYFLSEADYGVCFGIIDSLLANKFHGDLKRHLTNPEKKLLRELKEIFAKRDAREERDLVATETFGETVFEEKLEELDVFLDGFIGKMQGAFHQQK